MDDDLQATAPLEQAEEEGAGTTPPGRPTTLLAAVLLAACVGLIGGAASAWALYQRLGPAERIVSAPAAPGSNGKPADQSPTYASLAASTAPSMVRIATKSLTAADLASGSPSGLSTGFVVSSDGLVLTSAHAVQGATRLDVAFPDGTLAQATVAGTDTVHGLVLLQPHLPQGATSPAPLSFENFDTAAPRAGDLAIAVVLGPLGGTGVTAGTVSAVDRPLPPLAVGEGPIVGGLVVNAIADASFDGSPLLDAAGKVIGVVVDVPGGPPGIVALDGRSAASLVASAGGGTHTGPTLGLSSALLDAADAAAVHARPGALVVAVTAGGPAAQAGLKVGDVVTAVSGAQVTADHPLDAVRLGFATGQHVSLAVVRAGQELSVDLTVG